MYLTRFRVNTARTGARRLLSSPQSLHAAVKSSFAQAPQEPTGREPRVLWRLDYNANADVVLYIVSPDRPDLTHLVEQAGWPTTGGWETFSYAPLLDRIAVGDTWAFRRTANPVHSIRRKEGEPTKHTAHMTPRHQMGWLIKHQGAAGFNVVEKPMERRVLDSGDEYELVVHNRRGLAFGKNDQRTDEKLNVTLAAATFDGRLRVTDADAMRRTLTAGLGRAKAYGCGLMTLAPVS